MLYVYNMIKSVLRRIVVWILTCEARIVLWRHAPTIVAVTGSVGKTSTKDAIFTAVAERHHARKSEKSFNSELGVPLTILGLPTAWSSPFAWLENIGEGFVVALFGKEYPEWLVLEVGADRPGDIRKLAWLCPHVVVLTHFPDVPVHVEYFDSPEQVILEKRELVKALRPGGTLVINADDPKMHKEATTSGQSILSYGFHEDASIRASDITVTYSGGVPTGMSTTVRFQNEERPLVLAGTLGVHQVYPLLAAVAVAVADGSSFSAAVDSLKGHVAPPGRMRIIAGKDGSMLVDDTYNASPAAVRAGLQTIATLTCPGKKVVVLGDMLELGEYSGAEHRTVGEHVAHVADVFVASGVRIAAAADAVRATKDARCQAVHVVKDSTEASTLVRDMVASGDLVYVKGSQGVRMERVVKELMQDPSSAGELLVRQDKAWRVR
ncbi:MAG: UDP-N-acetylmuramoyl-tripeptide--D-alanyl-D-alanine ligase [Candidatus Pacebacteria bacterium]|nr:UDP-N-acetylmuramoyl-tripeptide--D-alanyl-D-alanine ligase [Candidatus Paceibacterota bacterium]